MKALGSFEMSGPTMPMTQSHIPANGIAYRHYLHTGPITKPGSNTYNKQNKRVEIKCQLDATEVFIADLIACSTCFGHHYAHHQELKSIIQLLLRVVFCAVVFQVAGLVWS